MLAPFPQLYPQSSFPSPPRSLSFLDSDPVPQSLFDELLNFLSLDMVLLLHLLFSLLSFDAPSSR